MHVAQSLVFSGVHVAQSLVFSKVHVAQSLVFSGVHVAQSLVFSGVHVAQSLVFCLEFCRSLFGLFLLAIVLSVVLRFMASSRYLQTFLIYQ